MLKLKLKELECQLLKFYEQNLKDVCEDRRRAVVVSSNLSNDNYLEPNGLKIPHLNLKEKILFATFSWFMPKELGCLVNLWLEENWGGDQLEIKAVLLNSKETALGYLLVSDRWNERDFFGNILIKENMKKLSRISIRHRQTSKPKREVWRRGYNDKGSLRLSSESIYFDHSLYQSVTQKLEEEELQNQKTEQLFEVVQERLMMEAYLETNQFQIVF